MYLQINSHIHSIVNKEHYDSHCDVCSYAKQHRLPFNKSSISSSIIVELLHIDLWGPYSEISLTGAHFFLTIVDDFSGCTWTYMLTNKADAFIAIKTFCSMVENQFQLKVMKVRTNNGTEFINSAFNNYFADKGIIYQKTCIYTL